MALWRKQMSIIGKKWTINCRESLSHTHVTWLFNHGKKEIILKSLIAENDSESRPRLLFQECERWEKKNFKPISAFVWVDKLQCFMVVLKKKIKLSAEWVRIEEPELWHSFRLYIVHVMRYNKWRIIKFVFICYFVYRIALNIGSDRLYNFGLK